MNSPRLPTSPDGAAPNSRCDSSAAARDTCRWVRIQLPRFLDGELPADLAARVSSHLEGCETCCEQLAAVRDDLCEVIGALVAAEPPAGLLARLHTRLDGEFAPAGAPAVRTAPSALPESPAPRAVASRNAPPRRVSAFARSFGPGLAAAAILAGILWAWPEEAEVRGPATARAPVSESWTPPVDAPIASAPAESAPAVRDEDPAAVMAQEGPVLAPSAEGEPLFTGGIECITFEEAIDTVIVGPLTWGAQLPGAGLASTGAGAALLVRRGDIDGNGRFEWKDLHGLFGYLREGREGDSAPACLAAADFDGDGSVTVHDSVIAAQALTRAAEWAAGDAPEVFAYESDNPLPCRTSCP